MAEEKTKKAIIITRTLLFNAFDDPSTMVLMAINDIPPEVIEDKIYEILEYLEKTAEKQKEEKKGGA